MARWRLFSREPCPPVFALGEFVVVDGRSGVLVSPPSGDDGFLAIWFGDTAGEDPVVDLVPLNRVYRWEGLQGPTYYH